MHKNHPSMETAKENATPSHLNPESTLNPKHTSGKTRQEKDSLGVLQVPVNALWGVQTQRALENFPISNLRAYPVFIKAYALIKKAAATANLKLKLLEPSKARVIVKAAQEVIDGQWDQEFQVDVYQAGAGTSFNMNMNEVIANRAIEILTKGQGKRGDYTLINPNDDVNMGQSTNDTFPTAIRVAACLHLKPLYKALKLLSDSFKIKGREFKNYVKAGRTHLQDAAPVTLGQEFMAYGDILDDCLMAIQQAEGHVRELGIGGSAVGTGLNTHKQYASTITKELSKLTKVDFRLSKNLHKSMQSQFPISTLSTALRNTALEMTRISNDLRLMASGPTSGFNEILLPAVQPGSSIMPGKVNPVMLECWNMTLYDVVGRDQTVLGCVQAGQFELNVMMPMMAHALLHNIEILTNISKAVAEKCIRGITADEKICRDYALKTVSLATALNPLIGYQKAAEVVKKAVATKTPITEMVVKMGYASAKDVKLVLDPMKMVTPGIAKKPKSEKKPLKTKK